MELKSIANIILKRYLTTTIMQNNHHIILS